MRVLPSLTVHENRLQYLSPKSTFSLWVKSQKKTFFANSLGEKNLEFFTCKKKKAEQKKNIAYHFCLLSENILKWTIRWIEKVVLR